MSITLVLACAALRLPPVQLSRRAVIVAPVLAPLPAFAGLFGDEPAVTYKGSAADLDLSALLDTVPEDPGGKKAPSATSRVSSGSRSAKRRRRPPQRRSMRL